MVIASSLYTSLGYESFPRNALLSDGRKPVVIQGVLFESLVCYTLASSWQAEIQPEFHSSVLCASLPRLLTPPWFWQSTQATRQLGYPLILVRHWHPVLGCLCRACPLDLVQPSRPYQLPSYTDAVLCPQALVLWSLVAPEHQARMPAFLCFT